MNRAFIIAFPHQPAIGGPGSFQVRFEKKAKTQGWIVEYQTAKKTPDVVMIVGGTRRVLWLLYMKLKGANVVHRLDGINWIHRKRKTSFIQYFLNEYRNFNTKLIHAFLSDYIVYQSKFAQDWWNASGWRNRKTCRVIHNGVDIHHFRPILSGEREIRVVCIEGNLDYSPYAIELINQLREKLPSNISIAMYGRFEQPESEGLLRHEITYYGVAERDNVPSILQDSVYLSLDVNPACPNTVIEALACGTPVVGFDTGSLKELVSENAGAIVPFGSDPWKLGFPDVEALSKAIINIIMQYPRYSTAARKLAVEKYSIEDMFQKYVEVIMSIK